MLERLSEKFAEKLVSAGIISEADTDVYVYGFFQAVMLLFNVVTTLLLGITFQLLIPCILLNLAYIPIRISAGGHHADSPLKCYIHSTIMIAVLLISSVVIWIFAPLETENNPLDEVEQHVYRKRTRIILVIEIVIVLLCLIFSKDQTAATIVLGLFTEALMLLVGIAEKYKIR